jgi:hypothetical protein
MNTNMNARGTTAEGTRQPHLFGTGGIFENKTAKDDASPVDARMLTMIWAKNGSGGALLPTRVIAWKTALYGKELAGYAAVGTIPDGAIDHQLPAAGVADTAACWIAVCGPARLTSDGASTLAIKDVLVVGATAGKVKKQVAAPADTTAAMVQVNSKVGHCEETVTNVDGTIFKADIRLP